MLSTKGIFLTLVCSLLLLGADITTEFGVQSSPRCNPQKKTGLLATASGGTDAGERWYDESKRFYGLITFTSQIQSIRFLERTLTAAPSVFPVHVTPKLCINCLISRKRPPLLSGCTIEDGPTYPAGKLTISVTRLPAFLNGISFNETRPGGKRYDGKGDMNFQNLKRCSIYSVLVEYGGNAERKGSISITFLEYANIQHCQEISLTTSGKINETLHFVTRGPTFAQEIHCSVNALSKDTLEQSLGLYRLVQFQFSLHPLNLDESAMRYQKLTVDDLYRAVLANRLTESSYETGDYFEYSECGQYDWDYLMPFIGSLLLLVLLGGISLFLSYDGRVRILGRERARSQDRIQKDNDRLEIEASFPPLSYPIETSSPYRPVQD